ncbi:hypothetical protein NGA35_10410 [Pseudomonas stutzeri]|nr:hypothetical protein [Stutzerimonas stutzeri]
MKWATRLPGIEELLPAGVAPEARLLLFLRSALARGADLPMADRRKARRIVPPGCAG